jgi:hypothetical protein
MHKHTRILPLRLPVYLPLLLALAACKGAGDDGDASGTDSGDTVGGVCPSDADFFEAQIWGPILSQSCVTCHNATGLAKDTRMVLLPADADGYLEHNLAEAREVAQVDVDGTSLLLLKPTNKAADGHKGGMLLTEDSAAYAALSEFVARSLGTFTCEAPGDGDEAAACDKGGAGVRRVRRLSHQEYNRSLSALLGAPTDYGLKFAPDTVIQGYSNNADALLVSGLLADQYREAAEAVAEQMVADLPARLGCDPATDGEPECAADFITRFGRQAFRRPLTATELTRYKTLWSEAAKAEDFAGGVRWTIAAILQSPGFLYRSELGEHVGDGIYELTAHELATELSYLIVGGPPDAELSAAADDGSLSDPKALQEQATRLLASVDSDRTLHRFVDEWLRLDRLKTVPRDMMLFPELTPEIRDAMLGETHRFVSSVYHGGGTFSELLTASYSFMSDPLAKYYSVPGGSGEADAEGFKRVDAVATAAGLLVHGSVLTTHALPTSSSPIHRGKLVRERLLCQDMPPPPASLNISPPPVDPALSTRERYLAHSSDPVCSGCHSRIDPIGFGFEHYDGVGRFRAMDGSHAVDASGEILLTAQTNGTFDGMDELAQLLAGSPEVESCYALQWSRFAVGSSDNSELLCVQDELDKAFMASEGRLDSLVLALVGTRFFRERGGAPTEDPGTGTTGGGSSGGETGSNNTTGSADTGDATTGGGTGPMTSPGIDAAFNVDSKWDAGECNTVTVTNTTDAPIVWQVAVKLPGTIQNFWNAKSMLVGDITVFTGEAYNAEVAAKTSTSFGYCLNY